jgi:hypothetical protein
MERLKSKSDLLHRRNKRIVDEYIGKISESKTRKSNSSLSSLASWSTSKMSFDHVFSLPTQTNNGQKNNYDEILQPKHLFKGNKQLGPISANLADFSIRRFQAVNEIAFKGIERGGIIIKCANNCKFEEGFVNIDDMKERWSKHVSESHQNELWNGFCNACGRLVLRKSKIDKNPKKFTKSTELEHIIEIHIFSVVLLPAGR